MPMLRGQSASSDRVGNAAPTNSPDEASLVGRVARGDLRAFEELYRIHHPRLTRFIANMLARPQLVEEVLNDTMLVVWRRAESFNGASKVSTWIFAIAYRKTLSALRRWDEPMEDKNAESRPSADVGPEE